MAIVPAAGSGLTDAPHPLRAAHGRLGRRQSWFGVVLRDTAWVYTTPSFTTRQRKEFLHSCPKFNWIANSSLRKRSLANRRQLHPYRPISVGYILHQVRRAACI